SEFFLRKRLWQKDGLIISAEPMVKAPALIAYDDFPQVGNNRADIGLTLSGGYSFKALGQYHFANLDTGYRYRFSKQKDQIRIAATVGINLDNQWTVMPQLFITRRTSSPAVGPAFNENPANDYNLTKVQLSSIYKMWDDTALQVGGFYHVDARNSSLGGGVLISLWDFF